MKSRAPNSNRIKAGLDGLCVLALALASAVVGNIARIPAGSVEQFLEMRVTLLNVMFAALFVLAWISLLGALGLYRQEQQSVFHVLKRAAQGCFTMAVALGLYLFIARTAGPMRRIAAIFFVTSLTFETARLISGRFIRWWFASRDPRVVVIVGSGRKAGIAWRQIRTRHHSTVKLLGFVDDRAVSEMAPDIADRYLGTMDQLSDILLRNVVDELLIALPTKSCYDSIERAIAIAEQVGVEVVYMQDLYVTTRRQRALDEPEMFTDLVPPQDHHMATQTIKRLLDVIGAAAGLLLLVPYFSGDCHRHSLDQRRHCFLFPGTLRLSPPHVPHVQVPQHGGERARVDGPVGRSERSGGTDFQDPARSADYSCGPDLAHHFD